MQRKNDDRRGPAGILKECSRVKLLWVVVRICLLVVWSRHGDAFVSEVSCLHCLIELRARFNIPPRWSTTRGADFTAPRTTVICVQVQKTNPHFSRTPPHPPTRTANPTPATTATLEQACDSFDLDPAYPRQRATTNMASQNIATYNDCVTSLRTSLNFLESSVETLGNGVSDFPRLTTILKSVRVSSPPLQLPLQMTPPRRPSAPSLKQNDGHKRPPKSAVTDKRPALRTNPPTNPLRRRILPPLRNNPLHNPPPRPRRLPPRPPRAPHRDAPRARGAAGGEAGREPLFLAWKRDEPRGRGEEAGGGREVEGEGREAEEGGAEVWG